MMAAQLEKPQSLVALAERIASLGFYPVPIPAGCKGPTVPGWDKLRLKPEDCAEWFADAGLVGILHVNTCVLDIDVTDPDLSARLCEEARRRFPGALERVGQAPKSSLWLRMEEPGFKVHNTVKLGQGGHEAQIEVRSVTRQAVAYGLHPDTRQPYRWIGAELWATLWADLPLADQAEVQAFRDWADKEIRAWGGVEDQPKIIDFGLYSGFTFADERPSEAVILKALDYISPSLGHEAGWREVLMALHDYYGGSARGLEVASQWSSGDPRYSPREVALKWSSFEPGKGVSYRSIFHHAKSGGANLSELSAMDRPQREAPRIRLDPGPGAEAGEEPEPEDEQSFDAPPEEPQPSKLEWFDDIEPVLSSAYLVKGVLDAGTMSVVYGPSNSGKTFFALDLAYHIAIGAMWRGHRVRQAGVLYLAAEGGRGVANRVAALRLTHGICDVPFALRRAGLDLLKSESDLQAVYDLAREVQARFPDLPLLIVVDTLSRVMAGGDENSAADMTALIRNIDAIREATGAHIMVVHHTGKDTAKGARGHSSLRAATDTELEVQNEDGIRAAMVTKQRDNAGGESFGFILKGVPLGVDQDGDEVATCVVEMSDEMPEKKRKLGPQQKMLLETLYQLIGEIGQPTPGGPSFPPMGKFRCVEMDALRAAFNGKYAGANARDAFKVAFEALRDDRRALQAAEGLVWPVGKAEPYGESK